VSHHIRTLSNFPTEVANMATTTTSAPNKSSKTKKKSSKKSKGPADRDPVADQLQKYKDQAKKEACPLL
jgi:hypothetical protein